MATPAQIRAACDAKLDQLRQYVVSRENTYFANHGHYWQGLRTHTIDPADGVEVLPTIGQRCPTDQQGYPWPSQFLTTPIPMSLRIDVYDGPLGQGYTGTLEVVIGANTWQRCEVFGPETWRAFGWRQMVPP